MHLQINFAGRISLKVKRVLKILFGYGAERIHLWGINHVLLCVMRIFLASNSRLWLFILAFLLNVISSLNTKRYSNLSSSRFFCIKKKVLTEIIDFREHFLATHQNVFVGILISRLAFMEFLGFRRMISRTRSSICSQSGGIPDTCFPAQRTFVCETHCDMSKSALQSVHL